MANSRLQNFPALPSGGMTRRQAVYNLLDISGSMRGLALEAVVHALEVFKNQALDEPFAADVMAIGLISFATVAVMLGGGLVPVRDLVLPKLVADGVTRLDLAFNVLAESLQRDVRPRTAEQPAADFGPIAFVLTDGAPTLDDGQPDTVNWRAARDAVLRPTAAGVARCHAIVVFGCGPNVDDETLKAISTGPAFHGSAVDFAPFFQFVSQTLTSSLRARRDPAELLRRLPAPRGVRRID